MKFTAEQISALISGTTFGDPTAEVDHVAGIETAGKGALTFLANPKYQQYIYTTKASVVLVANSFEPEKELTATLIKVDDPYSSIATLLSYYNEAVQQKRGISAQAFLHSDAKIGADCYIGEFSYIGANAVIGDRVIIYPQVFIGDNVVVNDDTVLYPGVKVYRNCKIGSDCIIHSGVVIGADGFGFAVQTDHQQKKVPQIGDVIIGNHVEIGANTTIDRATLGSTVISDGVKLDNLIQVAHNVEIGENTVIAAHTGLSGSVKIGKNCLIAGQVGMVGHISIADGVKIGAQSGIAGSIVEEGKALLGTPAVDASLQKRIFVFIKNLPELAARIGQLERKMKKLIQE